MNQVMKHRGPDGDGIWHGDGVLLAHCRLAIIDLSDSGAQPRQDPNTGSSITCNGELFNFHDLRRGLKRKGHVFCSHSDTEVLLHHLDQHAPSVDLRDLRGMFAFAYFNGQNRTLLLARDRAGQKPLFHARHGEFFLFASEIPALASGLRRLGTELNLDPTAIADYLVRGFVPWGRTMFREIHRLPPGHWLCISSSGERLFQYWTPFGQDRFQGNFQEAVMEFRLLFDKSIQHNLVSDVPVGVLLSGGVDSSSVAQAAVKVSTSRVSTFSLGQENKDQDLEFPFSRRMAIALGTEHQEVIFKSDHLARMPENTSDMGEPLGSPTIPMMLHLLRAVHESGMKVVLAGDGADEIFGGYRGYRWIRALDCLRMIPGLPAISGIVSPSCPTTFTDFGSWNRSAHRGLACRLFAAPASQYLQCYQAMSRRMALPLLRQEIRKDIQLGADTDLPQLNTESFFDAHLYWDLAYNDRNVVRNSDYSGMAHAVELRAPYLDHDLITFGFRLPISYRVGSYFNERRGNKRIIKQAFAGILPDEILYRNKMGFSEGSHVTRYLRGRWRDAWRESLAVHREHGFLHPAVLDCADKEVEKNDDTNSVMLWRIFALGLFLRERS